MKHRLPKRQLPVRQFLSFIALSCLVALSACSSDNTTTVLDADPSVSIELPDKLRSAVDQGVFEVRDLRPVVTLSSGATVSMNWDGGDRWSGVANVRTGGVYKVTVTWIERYQEQDLPLASMTRDLAVGNDGSVVETNSTEYSTDGFDADNDNISNFDERLDGSEPLSGDSGQPAPGPVDPVDPGVPTDPVIDDGGNGIALPITISMPGDLLRAIANDVFILGNLRPVVTLSNGAIITMNATGANQWSGTTNVAAGSVYQATIVWVENYEGQDLSLAGRTIDFAVGNDGVVVQSDGTGYNIDFNDDGDGPSNFAERVSGTDPLSPDAEPPSIDLADNDNNPVNDDNDPRSDAEQIEVVNPLPVTADVIVPRISESSAPVIDGRNVSVDGQNQLTGEWAQAIQADISGAQLSIDNLMIDIDAEDAGDVPYRRWAAMHDGRYLYVVVLVDDDGDRYRDSGGTLYHDDSLELFLDADNSKSQRYDSNDFHRIFPLREAGKKKLSKVGVSSGDVAGPNSSSVPLPINFATGPGIGPDGLRRAKNEQDIYELRIPLSAAGISTDAPFGFELQVNDDDDGLGRDAKWGWKHPARSGADVDNTYFNPSFMGTLMLE